MEATSATADENSVPWGPVAAVIGTGVIFFGAQLLAGLALLVLALLFGWNVESLDKWLVDKAIGQFVAILVVEALTLLALCLFLRTRHAKPQQLGLVRPRARDILYTLGGFAAYLPLYLISVAVISALIPGIDLEQRQELGFSPNASGNELYLIFISLVLLPPIVEEIISRGFLFGGLRGKLKFIPAALITSFIFALAHLQFGSGNALLWVAAIDTFILSMVLCGLREKTGSLWSPIGLHMIKNFIAFMALFVFKVA